MRNVIWSYFMWMLPFGCGAWWHSLGEDLSWGKVVVFALIFIAYFVWSVGFVDPLLELKAKRKGEE